MFKERHDWPKISLGSQTSQIYFEPCLPAIAGYAQFIGPIEKNVFSADADLWDFISMHIPVIKVDCTYL